MTNPAKKAVQNAISLECKKDGLQQKQNGDWKLCVTIAAADMDQRVTTAAMGTRYQCVLVEISDDESPVDHKAIERDKWRALGPVKQAGIRCKEPMFWAFLGEEVWSTGINGEEEAAEAVRDLCGVASRSHLGKPGYSDARVSWHNIENQYQAWKVREHG